MITTAQLAVIERLKQLVAYGTSEEGHSEADDILCQVIKELGSLAAMPEYAAEVVRLYGEVGKWYA
jgi:hypothetical protein